jgi:hypothetical protein
MAGATLSKYVKMAIPQHLRRSAGGVLMALTVTSEGPRSSILVLGNDFSDPKREFLRDHVTTFLQLVDVGWFWGALKQIFWICLDQVKSYAWISRVHFHPYSGDHAKASACSRTFSGQVSLIGWPQCSCPLNLRSSIYVICPRKLSRLLPDLKKRSSANHSIHSHENKLNIT